MSNGRTARLSDLASLVCAPDVTIRVGLQRLNATEDLFQLIADGEGHLLGTLTDGDIRRALLAGVGMDEPVAKAMQHAPKTAQARDITAAHRMLAGVRSVVPFLPLLNDRGAVVGVLVQRMGGPEFGAALVMAGGRGTRLGEKTRDMPKPLLRINGKPMIEHVVSRIEASGARQIYVATHYLSDQIESWCQIRQGAAQLEIIREPSPCGTAGALGFLPNDLDGPLLVMNADVVSNIDLSAFVTFHKHLGTDATVGVVRHEIEIPFGVVRADEFGEFLGIEEKPTLSHFVAAGVYLIGPQVRALVQKGNRLDMPELLASARKARLKIGVFPIHESWRDVGRPVDLEAADQSE
jgi:dTDP-glucose pyrophosphorylase